MNASELAGLMAGHDWRAVSQAEKTGPPFVAMVKPYLDNPDELQRLLAVDCVAVAGGDEAGGLLLARLDDANQQVRINAVNALHGYPPAGTALLQAYDASRDRYVRQQLALIAGRGDDVPVLELRSRLSLADRDPAMGEASDGLVAALAKREDGAERERFATMLAEARGERVKELIDLCKYIDQPWLVPALRPVLARDEVAVDLSSHRTTLRLRGKDLAVDEIARLTEAELSFEPNGATNYTDAQIVEVERVVEGFRP